MRQKQLLGILAMLLIPLCGTIAAAAGSQLAGIEVGTTGNVSTLTVRATGAFTHKESTPSSSVVYLDLAGVTPAEFAGMTKAVNALALSSYHVTGFRERGSDVTRIEFAFPANTVVAFREVPLGIQLRFEHTEAPPVPQRAYISDLRGTATVRNVSVARAKDGVQVEIAADAILVHKEMRLTNPDRVVIDLMNAIPAVRTNNIMVNTPEAHAVRIGRYQAKPPVTRIVVDVAADVNYEIFPDGHRLLVNLRSASTGMKANPAPPAVPAMNAGNTQQQSAAPKAQNSAEVAKAKAEAAAKTVAESSEAQPFVFIEPKFQVKGDAYAAPQQTSDGQPMAPPSKQNPADPAPQQPGPAMQQQDTQPVPAAQPQAPMQSQPAPATSAGRDPFGNPQAQQPAPTPSAPPHVQAVNLAREQQQNLQAPGTKPKRRYTGEPISVNLKDVDVKDFFRLIHEISGLNIVLDPNVRGTLTLVLDDVPWDQALDLVLQNNGLDKQVEGNVLRIATIDTLRKEADAERAKVEAQVLAGAITTYTHYLSYAHSKDVIPTVKKFLSSRGEVLADERTNAVIVRDIASTIPEVQRLLINLDRKTQEVEIEARVVAATRNFARDIGTQIGFGYGQGANSYGGVAAVGTSPQQVGYTAPPPYFTIPGVPVPDPTKLVPTVTNAAIPLNTNFGLPSPTSGLQFNRTIGSYRIDAILTAAESRGLLKILSRPRVVTQNNIQAVVRQGVKVPVVTQAQLGGPPTVTYVDAFLRLTVTPQITAEGTVFLNVEVENTTPDFGHQVQGNPTLVTQQALTNVLVTNGGTVVIGGVIQTQNTVNTAQVPLLGDIPILGYAFKRRTVSTSTQELIFFITPKIIET